MSDLKFADTHNLVAFLSKPTESEGFEQIVDFLNANLIKYALTINPIIYTSLDKKKVIITESIIRRDLQLEDAEGTDCLPNATIFEQLTHMGFVQVFVNKQVGDMSHHKRIYVTPSHTKKIFGNMKREGKGFSGRVTPLFPAMMVQAQEEIGEGSANPNDPYHTPIITQPSTSKPQKKQNPRKPKRKDTEIPQSSGPIEPIAYEAANEENVPTYSNDPLLSGEYSLKLKDLMEICTKLQQRVLDLENTKTAQAHEISSLKLRVKRLEKKGGSRTHKLKRLLKVGRSAQVVSFEDEDETHGRHDDPQMFDRDVFNGEEVFVAEQSEKVIEEVVSTAEVGAAATITTEEITLAQALAELRSAKPKVVVPELVLAREKAEKVEEANISWDNVQAMIEVDRLLAERLQAREQEELTDEEKARLFVKLLEKRKKHFATLRAQEKRNKPPTKAQKKSTMSTYLKHMAGYKQSQLKNKSFAKIQKLFDKAITRVNMFVDMDTELVKESSKKAEAEMAQESSSKRAGEELEQEVAKKQKMEDDKEKEDLKQCFEIVQDDEVAIDAIPLATKPAPIVNFQIHKKERNGYYEIMRADGSAKTYLLFSQLLKEFDREDLENLWKLVKAKHGNTRPEEGYERVL
ncbi:hypothetical protein Tco_0570851 [Tanacetum coccineum]